MIAADSTIRIVARSGGSGNHRRRLLPLRQHPGHFLLNDIDRLERPQHDLELDDPAIRVPLDHVDAVHGDAIDLDRELEHRIVLAHHFANVSKVRIEEDLKRGRQVLLRYLLATLRRVHDRRVEDDIVGEQIFEACGVAMPDEFVPAC